jgi:hypothetical protein
MDERQYTCAYGSYLVILSDILFNPSHPSLTVFLISHHIYTHTHVHSYTHTYIHTYILMYTIGGCGCFCACASGEHHAGAVIQCAADRIQCPGVLHLCRSVVTDDVRGMEETRGQIGVQVGHGFV